MTEPVVMQNTKVVATMASCSAATFRHGDGAAPSTQRACACSQASETDVGLLSFCACLCG